MSIVVRTLKDGTVVHDVREYASFTIDEKRNRKTVTCRSMDRWYLSLAPTSRDTYRRELGKRLRRAP